MTQQLALLDIWYILYTQWISRWIAAARERIPGSIDNDVTGVSECSQQRSNLKDDGYNITIIGNSIMLFLFIGLFFHLLNSVIFDENKNETLIGLLPNVEQTYATKLKDRIFL
ncbi:hypothetical protein [Photorhabdus laumondii]|uniref:hypothetical protein n=1 Tax=Photorhabdus laumondii TaxID=2218628 RepID=UPI0033145B2C